jgi:hypothetical protein
MKTSWTIRSRPFNCNRNPSQPRPQRLQSIFSLLSGALHHICLYLSSAFIKFSSTMTSQNNFFSAGGMLPVPAVIFHKITSQLNFLTAPLSQNRILVAITGQILAGPLSLN